MRLLLARRGTVVHERGFFLSTQRVSSASNVWADDLSRQRIDKVLSEATALGLTPHRLYPSASQRDLSWLYA